MRGGLAGGIAQGSGMGTMGRGGSLPALQQGGAEPCCHCHCCHCCHCRCCHCPCCHQHGRVPGPSTLQGLPLGDPERRILAPGLSLSEIRSSPPGTVLPSGKTPKIKWLGEKTPPYGLHQKKSHCNIQDFAGRRERTHTWRSHGAGTRSPRQHRPRGQDLPPQHAHPRQPSLQSSKLFY